MKGDSGASKHYFSANTTNLVTNHKHELGRPITLLKNNLIQASATAHLPLYNFPFNATDTYILKYLKDTSLISLGLLCDEDCFVILMKKALYVCKDKDISLEGFRNLSDVLWDITIPKQNPPKIKAFSFQNAQL